MSTKNELRMKEDMRSCDFLYEVRKLAKINNWELTVYQGASSHIKLILYKGDGLPLMAMIPSRRGKDYIMG